MDNFQPVSTVDPKELPDGFTLQDPHAKASGGGGGGGPMSEQQELQKEAILAQALTSSALERLRRIKLVRSVETVERAILQMAPRLTERITDDKLIEMLERSNRKQQGTTQSASISIQRKKYNMDSDDEDDNDDDLL
jgi:DNA-binding TFAR19-related protein (PDSD5 family)